jgi:hypothetical protein
MLWWSSAMVDNDDYWPEVSLLFAVVAADTCLAKRDFCENSKFIGNWSNC